MGGIWLIKLITEFIRLLKRLALVADFFEEVTMVYSAGGAFVWRKYFDATLN